MYNIIIGKEDYIKFEWDSRKAAINLAKHGVRFELLLMHFPTHTPDRFLT